MAPLSFPSSYRTRSMRRSLAALVLASLATAQSTWIVDAANGSGAHFTDLQAALNAGVVRDGDTLLVRAGDYGPCATSKGVTVLGEPGAKVSAGGFGAAAVRVANLPAGRTFVLDGLSIEHEAYSTTGVFLDHNLGPVHLDDVTVRGLAGVPTIFLVGQSLRVDHCALVTVNECSLRSGCGIVSVASHLIVTRSFVEGMHGLDLFQPISSTPAVRATGGSVHLGQVTAQGGHGAPTANFSRVAPSPALRADTAAMLTVAGDARSSIAAGGVNTDPVSAIVLVASTLHLGRAVVLRTNGNAPGIDNHSGNVIPADLPFLVAGSAPPAGTVDLELTSAPGDSVLVALGPPGAGTPLPFGTLWLDPVRSITLTSGTQGAAGRLTLLLPVPNHEALRGLLLAAQAVNVSAVSSEIRLTNPAFFSLH